MPGIKRASETPLNHGQAAKKRKETQPFSKSPKDALGPGKENGSAKQDHKRPDFKKADYKKLEEKQKIAMAMNSSAGSKCRCLK